MAQRVSGSRAVVIGALLVAVVLIGAVLLRAGSGYEVHLLSPDASQLVKGDTVEVGGRRIGTVKDIKLTSDNQADLVLNITADDYKPLRQGTVATVRPIGLSGVANRYIELTIPDGGAEIPDGGTLTANSTRPAVDLDMLLTSLDPEVRAKIKSVLANGKLIFQGNEEAANRVAAYLNPALSQTRAVTDELASDQAAVERLLTTSATLSSALVSRRPDLQEGISNTAATLRAIANEATALGDAIGRAPGVLRQGRSVLTSLTSTLAEVTPALREAQPSAAPLATLLRKLPTVAGRATPVLRDTREVLPAAAKALRGAPGLAKVTIPALRSTRTAIADALPIFEGLRPYTPEIVLGLTNGLLGATSASYDGNGHYARVQGRVSAQGVSGLLSLVPSLTAGQLTGFRTRLTGRCPGSAAEPADDKSNPWIPDPSVCNPGDSHR